MAETIRLNKVLRELNISLDRAVEFLDSKGIEIEKRPTTKISEETYNILSDEFEVDANKKVASKEVSEAKQKEKDLLREQREREIEAKQKEEAKKEEEVVKATKTLTGPKQVGKIDLSPKKKEAVPPKKEEKSKAKTVEEVKSLEPKKIEDSGKNEEKVKEEVSKKLVETEEGLVPEEKVTTQYKKLSGPKISGDKIRAQFSSGNQQEFISILSQIKKIQTSNKIQ